MTYLGKDTELRAALEQQQAAIKGAQAQVAANAEMDINKRQAFMIVLAVMALLVVFRR